MLAPGYRLLPPLSTAGGPSLPGDPFRLGAPHQACMENPLPELHPHGYRRPYFLGPTGTQRLREYDVGKDEGSLGVPTPVDYPLPFHGQKGCESAPHYSCGPGIPDI